MAYDNEQNEPALPTGNDETRSSVNHLPRYFRTNFNKKFLDATLDQLITPGLSEKINAFAGRRTAKAVEYSDTYLEDVTIDRENYQLEPSFVIKDDLDNVLQYVDYNDYINRLSLLRGSEVENHSYANEQEFYSWNPHIDYDKFVNFRDYYWLPNGPEPITVVGNTKEVSSTYTVSLKDNDDNLTYLFSPDGLTDNPSITLYRGLTYKFDVDVPNYPIAFATKRSFAPGEAILIEAFDGLRADGIYDITLYDGDDIVYDGGGYIIPPREASFSEGDQVNTSLIYDTGVSAYDEEGNAIKNVFIEKGTIEFTVPENAPDFLYYISKPDANVSGYIKIFDLEENTEINVGNEIIGKKEYTTNSGLPFSNGMKVNFAGSVTPENYGEGNWYVEGVGDKIQLISEVELSLKVTYTADFQVEYDNYTFDNVPFDEALGYPLEKDYIIINRASNDRNPWSRYNRWFHKDVIETAFYANNILPVIDESSRAKRPIIEFEKGLKLFNYGTKAIKDIDLVDNVTKDVFSKIEGSTGYNIDGIDLVDGMRVLFLADPDSFVKGKIFKVKMLKINNALQISLILDSEAVLNEVVFSLNGLNLKGKSFYFDGENWKEAQQKLSRNQEPLFELFDKDDISYADHSKYPNSQFLGNKVFSYKRGNGSNDLELGFPIQYKNIVNSGDVLFNFNLLDETFTYNNDNNPFLVSTDTGFLRKYDLYGNYEIVNGWQKGNKLSNQNVIRQYIYKPNVILYIDVYDNLVLDENFWIRVYKNNKLQFINKDFILSLDVNSRVFVNFIQPLQENDIILIKTRSNIPKNTNGYYEIPINLERNPLNENILEFTFGEVIDHVQTIVEELPNFDGIFPGKGNLRDIKFLSTYGKKFVKHSSPLNLSIYLTSTSELNLRQAIEFNALEYTKFKRKFFEIADTLGFEGPVRIHVDKILKEFTKNKSAEFPFYFSNMVPCTGTLVSETLIEDSDQIYFPIPSFFNFDDDLEKAVLVYQNDLQLIHEKDYFFNSENFVVLKRYMNVGDKIYVYFYNNTNGCFVPETPTKLGIYPSYEPTCFIDTMYSLSDLPDGEGPFKIYGKLETALDNKLGWCYPVYTNYEKARLHDIDLGSDGQVLIIKFAGVQQPFYLPASNNKIAATDSEKYIEYAPGIATLKGHDGSNVIAFKDYRDQLYLELEMRIFNNLHVKYDSNIFDIFDFVPSLYRTTGITNEKFVSSKISNFLSWQKTVGLEYQKNEVFVKENSFTYNYSSASFVDSNEDVPGWWRQIYRYAYDTFRPDLWPWEMLGFSIKPNWWEEQYGPAPYTSNNLLLWQDIEQGIVRQPKYMVKSKFARPGIMKHLPVNEDGNLLSPYSSNLVRLLKTKKYNDSFKFGDGAPVEYAWQTSSKFPYAVMYSALVNKTSKFLATGFDRLRQKKNKVGQIVYGDNERFITLTDLEFPNRLENKNTSGLINLIYNYFVSQTDLNFDNWIANVGKVKNQIGFKLGGFTDKDKISFILDSRTPLNQGNVFIPKQNYNVFLNKSLPIEEVVYSGVIIERQPEGFYIKGYDNYDPFFLYTPVINKMGNTTENIGGISEAFVNWAEQQTYYIGLIVRFEGSFYRCTVAHTSGNEFQKDNFVFLPKLPVYGGRDISIPKDFSKTLQKLNYGTLLTSIQDVVNFLLGYGNYLETKGFEFNVFNKKQYELIDFRYAVRQFCFWTLQEWGAGSVLTLSPGASKLVWSSKDKTIADNVLTSFYGYTVFDTSGTPLPPASVNFYKNSSNQFEISVRNDQSEGLFAVRIPTIYVEHVVLFDNKTSFNDVIFETSTGYRQERIKLLGYRTANWNGGFNIPGFIHDEAKIEIWEPFNDYKVGSLVKYGEFYYVADSQILGQESFQSDQFTRLNEKPSGGLFANLDYKANQFLDFYDLDSDNLDAQQQKLAQHLIGYQKRDYLANIINDDVSQYKFYQGFIQEKGTVNSLSKLFDVLSSNDKDSFEFYEEWAIKDGQYGTTYGFDVVEYILDQNKFKLVPQSFILTNNVTGKETDLIYRIQQHEVYTKSNSSSHTPFPVINNNLYLNTSGYVSSDFVDYTYTKYEDLLSIDVEQLNAGSKLWLGDKDKSWDVLKYVAADYYITGIYPKVGSQDSFLISLSETNHQLSIGEIVGIVDLHKSIPEQKDSTIIETTEESIVKGMFKIRNIELNAIELEADPILVAKILGQEFNQGYGTLSIFKSLRVSDVEFLAEKVSNTLEINDSIFIDDIDGKENWIVAKNENRYMVQNTVPNTVSSVTENFGEDVSVNEANTILAIGSPDDTDGKVYIYNRATSSLSWQLLEILVPQSGICEFGQKFGKTVELTKDGKFLFVGAPHASNVKTTFLGDFEENLDYAVGDVVRYNESLWKVLFPVEKSEQNILFPSFINYNNVYQTLGLDVEGTENIPFLLTGNYPFTDQIADHFLVRLPYDIFDGINVTDEIFLHWNKLTFVNQDQYELEDREPFNGAIPYINKNFLENNNHTVYEKVEVIIRFNTVLNLPKKGDILETFGATVEVAYVTQQAGNVVVYGKNINGILPRANSMSIGVNFVGEYEVVQPIEETNTSSVLGSYIMIKTSNYQVNDVTTDNGRGFLIVDVVTDSSQSVKQYYNILDTATEVIQSENTKNSYIRTITTQGFPGPFGISDVIYSDLYVVRAPKTFTDNAIVGDKITFYLNNFESNVGILKFRNITFLQTPTLQVGETLTQTTSDLSMVVFDNTVTIDPNSSPSNPIYSIKVHFIQGTLESFSTLGRLIGSESGDIDCRPIEFPTKITISKPQEIGLSYDILNKEQTIVDIWDGYVDYVITEFSTGSVVQPFEPIAKYRYNSSLGVLQDTGDIGQEVRDEITGAYGNVMVYERNGLNCRVYIKKGAGSVEWSFGDNYGDISTIEMKPYPNVNNPYPDPFGRPNIYNQNRTMGRILQVSMGYELSDIGKLLVFKAPTNLLTFFDGNEQINTLDDVEYWLYKEVDVLGIPKEANLPSANNRNYQEVYSLEADYYATSSGLVNQGLVYIYQKFGQNFILQSTLMSPKPEHQQFFGTDIKLSLQNDLYKAFISTDKTKNEYYDGPADNQAPTGNEENYIRLQVLYTKTETNVTDKIVGIVLNVKFNNQIVKYIDNLDEIIQFFNLQIDINGNYQELFSPTVRAIENSLKTKGVWVNGQGYYIKDLKANSSITDYSVINPAFTGIFVNDLWYSISLSVSDNIFMLKSGYENDILYNWEYSKHKKFRGSHNAQSSYNTGDIVYLGENLGSLYISLTNIEPGLFDPKFWEQQDSLVDVLGYLPNDKGIKFLDDSFDDSVLNQDDLEKFGSAYAVDKFGQILIVVAKYQHEGNHVVIYRNHNGFYKYSQSIISSSKILDFGASIDINDDGTLIAISVPNDDSRKLDQGVVYIYKQIDGEFTLHQTLFSPQNEVGEFFGTYLNISGNKIAIGSRNATGQVETTFDNNSTYFDNKFTTFKFKLENAGLIYLYEIIKDKFIFSHSISYRSTFGPVYYFGRGFVFNDTHLYSNMPTVKGDAFTVGLVVDYSINQNYLFQTIAEKKLPVDLNKIKRVFLYNKRTQKLVTNLDYIDPLQGKIAGIAEENISFKLYYDPAVYTNVNLTNLSVDAINSWSNENVGKLWWDLSNAKFYYPYFGDVTYSKNVWSTTYVNSSIDIYEWVESTILPTEWDELADTNIGLTQGISGTSRYGNDAYVEKRIYDKVSQTFVKRYYFWVKGKQILPSIENRTVDAATVGKLISNPSAEGYPFIAMIAADQFALYNCDSYLKDKDIVISFQFWTIEDQTINIHNQYQIVTEGLDFSLPNRNIIQKWFDSLIGYDENSRPVPNPALSEKEKYGILNQPRQSLFVNRFEALKQFIERVNSVLQKNLIVDNKNLENLKLEQEYPNQVKRIYDIVVQDLTELNLYGAANIKQATISLQILDGTVELVTITNPGRGYKVVPTYNIIGKGEGLELEFTINNVGALSSVSIINGGKGYKNNTYVEIRQFAALVINDETIQGKWAIYSRNDNTLSWNRIVSQGYNTNLYWNYIDWYADGYSFLTSSNYNIDYSYELFSLPDQIGDIVKINTIGSGGWLLLEKIDNQITRDYTVNYNVIGKENGTIKFSDTIYDMSKSLASFDGNTFDIKFYDSLPTTETRIILNAIKDDLFIDELKIEFNKLFFSSVRYAFSEQLFVDWAFKTNFVKIKHNAGELTEDITFNNDNLPSYEAYVKEAKPFKTKIREYVSSYEKIDNSKNSIIDFDLQPEYNNRNTLIRPKTVKIIGDSIIGADQLVYPDKHWLDNLGFEVLEIKVYEGGRGYQTPPVIKFESQSGDGAVAEAKLGKDGSITDILVRDSGKGYLTTPKIIIDGSLDENGIEARASVIIGNSLPRQIKTDIKFDRILKKPYYTSLDVVEDFIGSGSKYIYDLKWPIDTKKKSITIEINNLELLRGQYTVENYEDNSKTYVRYFGRIIFDTPPANFDGVVIRYKKNINLLSAVDRIKLFYDPTTTQFGNDIGQLLDGIDYGGVEVKSFDFGGLFGWDTTPYFTGNYDTYDTTYEDEVIKIDGSTAIITLSKPLENQVYYNFYKNNIRLDDINFTGDSTTVTNPNAIMSSILGDGETLDINIQNLGVYVEADDVITIRKETSDGSFLPTNITYDTVVEGGNLNYANAKGLLADEINIDGDNFVTQLTSKGPEELIPGQVQDTLDIKVYERPTGGASNILTVKYVGNGITSNYKLVKKPKLDEFLLVKVDNVVQKIEIDYVINHDSNEVIFTNTAPNVGSTISFVLLDYSGNFILDIDSFTSDGSTTMITTNVKYNDNASILISTEGKELEYVKYSLDNGNLGIKLATPLLANKIVDYAIFDGPVINYSQVTIDNFEADGSTKTFELSDVPFSQEPLEWNILVFKNSKLLNAGYTQTFKLTESKEYRLRLYQVPLDSVNGSDIRVFINNQEIVYLKDWSFSAADDIDLTLPADQQFGSTIKLENIVGKPGDKMVVYITANDSDSTKLSSGGDYSFGYYNGDTFVSTPGVLHINTSLDEFDKIQVYQFSNHDSQGIDRQSFDVTERTDLSPGKPTAESVHTFDGSTTKINLSFIMQEGKFYSVFLNNVRIDDPYYGTEIDVQNPNAIVQTLQGYNNNTLELDEMGIFVDIGDVLKIKQIDSTIEFDESTNNWYELRKMRNGIFPLNSPAVDDQYVWVSINGELLTSSVDYVVSNDRNQILIDRKINELDNVEIIHFANDRLKNKFGWRQFKDILNRNHYKVLDGTKNITLAKDLMWYDKIIVLNNAESLPNPSSSTRYPGVVFVNGERIEYFVKDGNELKQLRRGTLGTGIKEKNLIGTEIYDQSANKTLPYKDEIYTTIFTADGTTKSYELDFIANSVNEFEVFVAGKRLRKVAIQSYQLDTVERDLYSKVGEAASIDSPEGDVTLPPEFSLQDNNHLVLLDMPLENQKIIVIRKKGVLWTLPGVPLSEANNDISQFLQSTQVDLPR